MRRGEAPRRTGPPGRRSGPCRAQRHHRRQAASAGRRRLGERFDGRRTVAAAPRAEHRVCLAALLQLGPPLLRAEHLGAGPGHRQAGVQRVRRVDAGPRRPGIHGAVLVDLHSVAVVAGGGEVDGLQLRPAGLHEAREVFAVPLARVAAGEGQPHQAHPAAASRPAHGRSVAPSAGRRPPDPAGVAQRGGASG
ncbi:MAG: hypothetical protein ACK559_02795, partial [bacterium]